MNAKSELETVRPVTPEKNIIATVLVTASDVAFTEGHPPYAMSAGNMVRLNVAPVTREDIDNFVRASAPADAVEKLENLSTKTKEDYQGGQLWDNINYSITTDDYSYRANYKMSMSGAGLTVRRIPRRSNPSVSPGNPLGAESPTNQLTAL